MAVARRARAPAAFMLVPPAARFRHPDVPMALAGAGGALVVGVGAGFGPLAGLGALLAVALGLVVLERPAVGAYVLVAAAPVLSGLRRGLPVPGLRISELLIVGLAGLVIVYAGRAELRPWRGLDWLALAYVATTFGLGAYDVLAFHRDVGGETLRSLLGPLQYLLLYRAVLAGLPDAAARAGALALLLVASVPVSLLALLQHFHLLGVRELIPHLTGIDIDTSFGAEGGGQRATSTFPHWQVLAAYAWWVALLAIALLLDDAQRVLRRGTLAVVLALALGAALATTTFTALLGIVVGAVALAVLSGRGGRVTAALLVGMALAGLVFGTALERRFDQQFTTTSGAARPAWIPQTVGFRYDLWTQQYLPALSGKWPTGFGPDLPRSVRFPYTESLYMTLLLRGGVVLLVVVLAFMGVLLAAGLRARDGPEAAGRAAGRVTVVAVGLLVGMHFIEPYFLNTGMAHLLWITAALVAGAAPASHRARPASLAPAGA
jgi:hypothetical protein